MTSIASDAPGLTMPERARRRRLIQVAVAIAIGVVLAFVILAASGGVRGSDQYWYLADVDTLIQSGSIATNNVFPVGLLGDGRTPPPPFVHNILSVYLAAIPGLFVGAFAGWLVMDAVAVGATALLIYLTARRVATPAVALICGLAYLLSPMTFWHLAQPLSEPSIAFFAALVLFLIVDAGSRARQWLLITFVLGLLYLSRTSYVLLLVAGPIGLLLARWAERPRQVVRVIAPVAACAALAIGFLAIGRLAAVENVNRSLGRLLHTSVPDLTGNMWFNFDLSAANLDNQLPIDLGLLPVKAIDHLAQQIIRFDSPAVAVFYWIFNALAIVAVVMLWRVRRDPRRRLIVLAALAPVVIHLMTIIWFQNQVRYLLPAIPGLLVVLAMALSEVRPVASFVQRRTALSVLLMVVVAMPALAVMTWSIRSEGLHDAALRERTAALIDPHVGSDETMLVVYIDGAQILFGYVARPRPVIYVDPAYTVTELARIDDRVQPAWILAPVGSPVLDRLPIDEPAAGRMDADGTEWGIYRLSDRSAAGHEDPMTSTALR